MWFGWVLKREFCNISRCFSKIKLDESIDENVATETELTLAGETLGNIIVMTIYELQLPITKCIGVTTNSCSVMLVDCGALKEIQIEATNAITILLQW